MFVDKGVPHSAFSDPRVPLMPAIRLFRLNVLVIALCAVALSAAAQSSSLKTWYLAEGATYGPFDEFVLIANPNETPVAARVTLLRPPITVGGVLTPQQAIRHTYQLLATSRKTLWITRDIPELVGVGTNVSVVVECLEQDGTTACTGDKGLVVERSMYLSLIHISEPTRLGMISYAV